MGVCPICLSEFETDFAIIPELDCNCMYVVHEECWDQWNYSCIYCRSYTISNTFDNLSEIYSRANKCKNKVKLLILVWFFLLFFIYRGLLNLSIP